MRQGMQKRQGIFAANALGVSRLGGKSAAIACVAFADDAEKMNSGMMNLGSALGTAERIDGGVARKR